MLRRNSFYEVDVMCCRMLNSRTEQLTGAFDGFSARLEKERCC